MRLTFLVPCSPIERLHGKLMVFGPKAAGFMTRWGKGQRGVGDLHLVGLSGSRFQCQTAGDKNVSAADPSAEKV